MEGHRLLSDEEFLSQFISCNLPPSLFTHEAHLRLAFLLIKFEGVDRAIQSIQRHIKRYVSNLNAIDKYNKTLTIAATKAVNHFIHKSREEKFEDFLMKSPRLLTSFKDLMASHYSYDIYHNPKAKELFLEPDLLPFD